MPGSMSKSGSKGGCGVRIWGQVLGSRLTVQGTGERVGIVMRLWLPNARFDVGLGFEGKGRRLDLGPGAGVGACREGLGSRTRLLPCQEGRLSDESGRQAGHGGGGQRSA